MVLNSTVIANTAVAEAAPNEGGGNATRLVVNTTDFNDRDFNDFITITEGMGLQQRKRRSHRRSRNNTIVATMTRGELFESTNLDDDQFLNALEHQNSYDDGHSETDPALKNSIENLMKYFDEDVEVNEDSSAKTSPTKLKTKGKVASAVASLRSKASGMTPSPLSKRKNKQKLEVKTNIQELKKRYELSPEAVVAKSPKSLKLSPKFLRKSKVRQMASMFNTKLNAIIRKDSPEPHTPEPISPGLESISSISPKFTSTLKPKSPKLKAKLPTFIAKLPSPKPSPFFKRRQMQKATSVLSLTGSPASQRKQLQKQPSTTCLVAENVFSQLTVKDKALLYNKFIEDMSKQNPKFSKHAQILESNVQREIARGEVVVEKQGTVKHLRETLEAMITPTKAHQQLSKTLQRFKRSPVGLTSPATPPSKAKEFEDIIRPPTPPTTPGPAEDDSEDPLHVSTLTVVLKASPESKKFATKPRSGRKKRDVRFHTDVCVIEPSFKRTQEMIRSSLPVEPYAPPKKIRRTQHERLAPRMFFQNQHLEKLFYNWLKEKNGVAFDITPLDDSSDVIEIVPKDSKDNAISKDKIDEMLEEAIKKLEAEKGEMEQEQKDSKDKQQAKDDNAFKEDEKAIQLIKQTREDEQCLEKSVIEVELPLEIEVGISRCKEPPMEDSDLGLTSINKTTSEDSHCELSQPQPSVAALKSPGKPMRKKKLRRSITWKKENSLVESQLISTTDSDSDSRAQHLATNATLPKSKKCSNYVKKLFSKTADNSSICSERSSSIATTPELSIVELDRSLIRQVNSPSKIKTAYTLTVMSSPSPPTESDFCDSDLPPTPVKKTSRSLPSLLEVGGSLDENDEAAAHKLRDKSVSTEFTDLAKNKLLAQEQQRLMVDSFIDQGFETGSNDMDSPMRLPKKSVTKELDQSLMRQENPTNFSTPLKDKPVHQVFTATKGMSNANAPPHLISPIPNSHVPAAHLKNLTMQVIKEDCVLDEYTPAQLTPSSLNESASFFAAETSSNNTSSALGVTHKVQTSQFWIATGDFTAALNIHHYESDRLMLLSNIFGQKCMDNRGMTFGIDAYKFSIHSTSYCEEIFKKVPKVNNCSQYWFCTGDVVLPFAGKQLSKQKIETFFAYLREFMDDPNGGLRFGIDTYEFSYHQALMPNDTWTSGSAVKTSDLDQSDLESVESEQSISFSALGGNHSDTASLKSEELINPSQTYALPDVDADALEQIFEDARNLNLSKTQTDKLALESQFTVPEMLKTLQNQQHKLKSLEERMLSCSNSGFQKNLEHFNESPDYMRKLRSIISAIDNIGRGNGFDACSIEQLESFMFFLSRYADLCLASCTAHIEKILDVVMNQRSFQA